MKRRVGWPFLMGSIVIAACSGGGDEARGPGSGEADAAEGSPPAAAAGQSMSSGRGTVPMKVNASVDGDDYESSGTGECAAAPEASIYDVPANLWRAAYEGPEGSDAYRLNLTVWRPKTGGAEMVGLHLSRGETAHRISTVRGGEMAGSGTAGVRPAGGGGTLTVSGKDDHGHAVELSVECERFDEVVAEGG
jgi:hypothetical protein